MIAICLAIGFAANAYALEAPSWVQAEKAILDESPSEEALNAIQVYDNEYLGEFSVTAYCGCAECNGRWAGYPAKNGEELEDGWTIAVDPGVIPIGSYVLIEGVGVRKAQDTGSAINGNDIDLFFGSHAQTNEWGRQSRRVWILSSPI